MKATKATRVKVIKSPNNLLWYSKYIGKEFDVVREEQKAVWVYEPDEFFRLINWIYKEDVEFLSNDLKISCEFVE